MHYTGHQVAKSQTQLSDFHFTLITPFIRVEIEFKKHYLSDKKKNDLRIYFSRVLFYIFDKLKNLLTPRNSNVWNYK